jgi:RNA polymerase sigma-70 factor (ECF subfamily)
MLESMRLATPGSDAVIDDPRAAPAETALLARARGGDREAFAILIAAQVDRVWAIVWRVLRHHEDTEDVVQEVFLSAWQALPGFRGDARLSTWLQTIAMSRALNHRARAAEKVRRASVSLETPVGEGAAGDASSGRAGSLAAFEPPDPHPASSPLRALEGRELRRRLAHCLDRLPREWRAVLALRDGAGESYEAIAAALDLALGTVRSRLSRARLALKECVEGRS